MVTDKQKKNLRKFNEMSAREHRELSVRGANASNEAKREKKWLKYLADTIGERKMNGKVLKKIAKLIDMPEEELTHDAGVIVTLYDEAIDKGNVRAAELLAKIKGELRDKTDVNLRGGVEVRVASKEDAEEINDIENL